MLENGQRNTGLEKREMCGKMSQEIKERRKEKYVKNELKDIRS